MCSILGTHLSQQLGKTDLWLSWGGWISQQACTPPLHATPPGMTSSMRGKCSSSPRVCAPLTPSLCVGRSCSSAQETCVRSGGQSPRLRDRRACPGGVACSRGCSHSSFLREGPALPQADGRWLEHLPNRLRAGSRASCCLTSLDAPGCCCLLWVAGREPGGGSQVWMRWVGWEEPSSCLLCTVVAASASAETWGGLGVPFSLWLAGRVGRGAVVPPPCSPWPLTFASP